MISYRGIVNLGNLLAVSPPRTTANLLICGPGVCRGQLKNREGLPQLDNAVALEFAKCVTERAKFEVGERFTDADSITLNHPTRVGYNAGRSVARCDR